MLKIEDLGLTPLQYSEVDDYEPALVDAWLDAASGSGIRSPKAIFLSGIRSCQLPREASTPERAQAIVRAERWLVNCGYHVPVLSEVMDELFERPRSILHYWQEDEEVRARIEELWRMHRPRGERVERERDERGERYRRSREAIYPPPRGGDSDSAEGSPTTWWREATGEQVRAGAPGGDGAAREESGS